MQPAIQEVTERIKRYEPIIAGLFEEMGKVIVGQRYLLERMVIGLLMDGHILVEGVPGLAKTTAVKTLAQILKAHFKRIQFTPDLLPADLIGTQIYNPKTQEFGVKKGPIFTNILLADEINRAPAKVQSALLEAMQERQVTIGDETFPLPRPFIVLATQNPIEQEGTYPLPEAQVDRFMLKLNVSYPTRGEEAAIIERVDSNRSYEMTARLMPEDLWAIREVIDQVYIDPKVKDYIVKIVFATREPKELNLGIENYIQFGASPRASIYLYQVSKAYAFLQGRGYVTPQDVKTMGFDVLRHRIITTYEAEAEGLTTDQIIQKVFDNVEVP
jgi:MoxR-like ATPase